MKDQELDELEADIKDKLMEWLHEIRGETTTRGDLEEVVTRCNTYRCAATLLIERIEEVFDRLEDLGIATKIHPFHEPSELN